MSLNVQVAETTAYVMKECANVMPAGQESPVIQIFVQMRIAQIMAYVIWENACVIQAMVDSIVNKNAQQTGNFIITGAGVMRAIWERTVKLPWFALKDVIHTVLVVTENAGVMWAMMDPIVFTSKRVQAAATIKAFVVWGIAIVTRALPNQTAKNWQCAKVTAPNKVYVVWDNVSVTMASREINVRRKK